ncbi:MAG: T9SS type A sorting domain-containing protein [Bacteroidota bacterium]
MPCPAAILHLSILIEPSTYQGENFPTAEQENVICEVFSYLAGEITAPGSGGTVNIHVEFDPGIVSSGAAGVGTPLFDQQCGIGFSNVQVQLNANNPVLPPDFIHGFIKINPGPKWYTEIDLMPAIGDDEVDLYTVVLHEALHVLGFGSAIGADGTPFDGYYTIYDLGLEDLSGNPMVLSAGASNDCCKEYSFNSVDFPNMPDDILQCGDIVFDVSQSPPTHGEYGVLPPLTDMLTANILSHLNITCGSDHYVMHAQIGEGLTNDIDDTPNIRRTLTATESEILCTIGYDVNASCSSSCFLIVRDDGPIVLHDAIEVLPYSTFTDNDFDAAGMYDVTFDFLCGDVGNMIFTPDNQSDELTINLNGTPFGTYEFCYSITSCNGDLCANGEITVIVAEEIDPGTCPENDCNLVGYGDFEVFPIGGNTYYQGFGDPANSAFILMDPLAANGPLGNSVDIVSDGNNNYVRFNNGFPFENENVLTPLCVEVPTDCGIQLDFDACARTSLGVTKSLKVWALSQLPTGLELPSIIDCDGEIQDNSGIVIGTCIDEFDLPFCPLMTNFPMITTPSLTHFSTNIPNGLDHPVNYLFFWAYSPALSGGAAVYMDNLVLTTECQNKISIASTAISSCIGGQGAVEIEVCLNGTLDTPADVVIAPSLQGIPGISLSNSNPDFPNGLATINNIQLGTCSTVTLYLDISESYQAGVQLSIPLHVDVTGACIEDADNQAFEMTLENCNCDCPDGSLAIGMPGAETLLSSVAGTGPNDLPVSPTTPIIMVLDGTLVIDADAIAGAAGYYNFPAGSQICMMQGASIVIPSDNELEIFENTHIRGCNKRWDAIRAEGGGRLEILGTSGAPVLIEDGQHAIEPQTGAVTILRNADFNDNFIGVFLGTSAIGSYTGFFGNTFRGTDVLLPHFDGASPDDGPWAFTGIQAIGMPFVNISSGNTFSNLRNGVLGENSSIRVNPNTTFEDITANTDYNITGRAVRLEGEGQQVAVSGSDFTNCTWGIQGIGVRVDARSNTMTEMITGIELTQGTNMVVNVTHGNNISATERCVFLSETDGAIVDINGNTFNIVPPTPQQPDDPGISIAVDIHEGGGPHPRDVFVVSNVISTQGIRSDAGIRMLRTNGYDVACNQVTAIGDMPNFYSGIFLLNAANLQVIDNDVTGSMNTGSAGIESPTALRVQGTTNTDYNSNSVNGLPIGVQFRMGCIGTDLMKTDFGSHFFSLQYTATGSTGPQPPFTAENYLHYGNRWQGGAGGAEARHETSDVNVLIQSIFTIPTITLPLNPVDIDVNPSAGTPGDWFKVQTNAGSSVIGQVCLDVQTPCCASDLMTDTEERIATGNFATDGYDAPLTWDAEMYLYERLMADNSLMPVGSVYETFYNTHAVTSIGDFNNVKLNLWEALVFDSQEFSQWENYIETQNLLMSDQVDTEDQLSTATSQQWDNLFSQWVTKSSQLASANGDLINFIQAFQSQRAIEVQTASVQNSAVITSGIHEDNEKTVNGAMLSASLQGGPDAAQITTLDAIASQCPLSGGTAVFRARSFLSGYTGTVYDDGACNTPQYRKSEGQVNDTVFESFTVRPNPATGHFIVDSGIGYFREGQIVSVHDLNGKRVFHSVLSEGDKSVIFETTALVPGIYFVKITDSNNLIFSTKVVVYR